MAIQYLHTMVRVRDIEQSKRFYCDLLGLEEVRRKDLTAAKATLVFLAPPGGGPGSEIELTYNWDSEEVYETGRSWGHLAYRVDNIYETCQRLMDGGVTINRPPRDGRMAFVKSPDGVSVELLQAGDALPPQEPWASMENTGTW
ncbi:MAG: VOC family protein [Neomegalonema sp.]|nr:VOC family protein [Neomegalonema sp.]